MKKNVILIVEDDQLDVISVRRSLDKLGVPYHLHTAYNGIEALEILRGKDDRPPLEPLPDILLLDINMPKMNGIEFLRSMRADRRLTHIKVFVMTTSGESQDRQLAEELGISGYLIKPLNYTNNTKRADSMDSFVQFYIGKILREEGN
ncbi:MAG TPA: response regulator [Puia sp.]|jgi:CheY-like chemotaxis protein